MVAPTSQYANPPQVLENRPQILATFTLTMGYQDSRCRTSNGSDASVQLKVPSTSIKAINVHMGVNPRLWVIVLAS